MHGSQLMVVVIIGLVLISGLIKARYRYYGEKAGKLAESDDLSEMQERDSGV